MVREPLGGALARALACALAYASLGCGALRAGPIPDEMGPALTGDEMDAFPTGDSARAGHGHDRRVPVVGAVLPLEGSPSMRESARLFSEGLRVGVELARDAGLEVELVVEDNRGTPPGSVSAAAALAERGVLAVLGPLDSDNLLAAVAAAPDDLAFFSPTAGRLPEGRAGVYSLAAGDAEAGRALAAALWELGHRRAVVLHPRRSRERLEADAFRSAFESLGGVVRRSIEYSPGTTTFEAPLMEAKSLAPSLLVVAAPAADIRLLAPQIAFFGLDELDLQVAGTAGWSEPSVLEGVPTRHTDGVVALSTAPAGERPGPPSEFVAAYESLFRRSLHSAVPVQGYDLLNMVLGAHARGAARAADVRERLELIDELPGVGATYTFARGRLGRRYFAVRVEGGKLRRLDGAPLEPGTPGPCAESSGRPPPPAPAPSR